MKCGYCEGRGRAVVELSAEQHGGEAAAYSVPIISDCAVCAGTGERPDKRKRRSRREDTILALVHDNPNGPA